MLNYLQGSLCSAEHDSNHLSHTGGPPQLQQSACDTDEDECDVAESRLRLPKAEIHSSPWLCDTSPPTSWSTIRQRKSVQRASSQAWPQKYQSHTIRAVRQAMNSSKGLLDRARGAKEAQEEQDRSRKRQMQIQALSERMRLATRRKQNARKEQQEGVKSACCVGLQNLPSKANVVQDVTAGADHSLESPKKTRRPNASSHVDSATLEKVVRRPVRQSQGKTKPDTPAKKALQRLHSPLVGEAHNLRPLVMPFTAKKRTSHCIDHCL